MQVTLLHYTPIQVCQRAIRTCWDSHSRSDSSEDKLGCQDKQLIDRVGNKLKHKSVLEHLVYTFTIDGISRACLQELARHRIASLSVKSTRYTLKELLGEEAFTPITDETLARASKYIVFSQNKEILALSMTALETLRNKVTHGLSNDILKPLIPECYKTSLVWTINARSLQNFLSLRLSPQAYPEIQALASNILKNIPDEHKFIFNSL